MNKYRIIRYSRASGRKSVVKQGLSLLEANELILQYQDCETWQFKISKQL